MGALTWCPTWKRSAHRIVGARGRGGEGRGHPRLWKIEAEVESEEENWAASHGASLRGPQGPRRKRGCEALTREKGGANRATGVRGVREPSSPKAGLEDEEAGGGAGGCHISTTSWMVCMYACPCMYTADTLHTPTHACVRTAGAKPVPGWGPDDVAA